MPGPFIDILDLIDDGEFPKRSGTTLTGDSINELAADVANNAAAQAVLDARYSPASLEAQVDSLVITGGGMAPAQPEDIADATDNTVALTPASLPNVDARYSGSADLFDRYSNKANGQPATADSGHAWSNWGQQLPGGYMQVVSGKLTNLTASGVAAGYLQHDLGAPVTRLGADVTFGAYTTNNGYFTLISWASIYGGGPVPDSGCHLVVGPLAWYYSVWEGGVDTEIASGAFSPALTADGATVHRVEVTLDVEDSVAYIDLPDGSQEIISDSRIASLAGNVAVFETFATEASTDSKTAAVNVWADAETAASPRRVGALSPVIVKRRLGDLANYDPVADVHAPATNEDATATGSYTVVNASLNATVTAPDSGKVLVEITAWLSMSGSDTVLWAISEGTTNKYVWRVANAQTLNGNQTVRGIITGLTPGTAYTLQLRHLRTGATTTLVKLDGPNGYGATIVLTPLRA